MTNKHTKRTLDEKENFISAFLKSNMSMAKWCKENQIPITTFRGWMKNKKGKVTFIPLKPSDSNVNSTFEKAATLDLIIEFKDFKFNISNDSSIELLEKTIKVVKNLYV